MERKIKKGKEEKGLRQNFEGGRTRGFWGVKGLGGKGKGGQ